MKVYNVKLIEKNIGLCIYVLRKEHALSARQLGYMLGKSECAVTAWERGEKNPTINLILEMCNLFSCTIDDFFKAHERIHNCELPYPIKRCGFATRSFINIMDDLICGNIQFSQFGRGCRDYLQRIQSRVS